MSTLDVVAEVLREVAPRALKAREIAALAKGRLSSTSKTPETVISRDLAVDVKRNGATSRFLRVGPGEFVLKRALATALFSDNDAYVAQWSRNLMDAGELAPGVVDERSIRDLKPEDIASFRQFHAFSGIGVWSAALREAGWSDDIPIFTGSCPCQGWSSAGQRRGFSDVRHLWPEWFRLIKATRPPVVVGEQVGSKDARAWLDAVFSNLEAIGYTCFASDLPASCVGAPHKRQRLFFAAVLPGAELDDVTRRLIAARASVGMADSGRAGCAQLGAPWLHDRWQSGDDATGCSSASNRSAGSLADTERGLRDTWGPSEPHGRPQIEPDGYGTAGSSSMGDPGRDRAWEHARKLSRDEAQHDVGPTARDHTSLYPGAVGGFWGNADWVPCLDGVARPVKPGLAVLVARTPRGMGTNRAARLKGYGNSIVKEVATTFIAALIDALIDDYTTEVA